MRLSIRTLTIAIALAAFLVLCSSCSDDGAGSLEVDASDPPAGDVTASPDSGSTTSPPAVPTPTVPVPVVPTPDEAKIVTISKTFEYSNEELMNPERGFYGWIGTTEALDAKKDYLKYRQSGQTLTYVDMQFDKIDANAFRDKPLSNAFLQDLADFFGRVRKAGIKLVFRFCYGDKAPDAPLARILEHIGQLKPVLQENADVVAVLQAGFIGYWGEWHHSGGVDTYGLDNTPSRAAVLDALLDALPKGGALQVRKPSFKTDHLGTTDPLEVSSAHNGEAGARIGHHNDCFLASDTDMGTYPSSQIDFWKDYIEHDGAFVPVGGETCKLNPPRSDCETAVSEMKRLNWSFINAEYDTNVISSWDAGGCLPDIQRDLGYRFTLEVASWNESTPPSGVLTLKATIKNFGYAAPFNERPLYAVLTGAGCYKAKLMADPRFWGGGSQNEIAANIALPSEISDGTYELSLWLPDPGAQLESDPKYSIRFANVGTWDENTGYNILTDSFLIDKNAPKAELASDAPFEPCECLGSGFGN